MYMKMFFKYMFFLTILITKNNFSSAENSDCGCSDKIGRQKVGNKMKDSINILEETVKKNSEDLVQPIENKNIKYYDEMVYILGGEFVIGSNKPVIQADGESPARKVFLDNFWIDVHEVSNFQFEKFVHETGYVTETEKFGSSFVLEHFIPEDIKSKIKQAVAGAPWWLPINGSSWKNPIGPGSHFIGDHPVVHVSWNDANAFCTHYSKRLPTEAEWEVACRGGKVDRLFPWGNKENPSKEHLMNIWQGKFPQENTQEDGYAAFGPVWAYKEQNAHKLKNMVGNVWEWVQDWWTIRHSTENLNNPKGPSEGSDKVKKGGSFACKKEYCYRYRCGARHKNTPDSSAYNLGFRCAADQNNYKEKQDKREAKYEHKDEL